MFTDTAHSLKHFLPSIPASVMRGAFLLAASLLTTSAHAQLQNFTPVTQQILENPSANDWLHFSRTYDAQRYSPLAQINTSNVNTLALRWSKHFSTGNTETIPLVYSGVMYVVAPGAQVLALDATNGDELWRYQHKVSDSVGSTARTKNLGLFGDVLVYTAPDSLIIGLDARTGAVRWQASAGTRGHTSGPLIVNGLAIAGGACFGNRDNCYLSAHDVSTGKEVWRFYTTPKPGEPGDESWHGAELSNRQASTWGLPGSYDPTLKQLYWGIANAMPDRRSARHGGDALATPLTAPADLYSNSTVALNPATGQLDWYYQHLPGDDWDLDATHERTLVTTTLTPDPEHLKWINPNIKAGEQRDIAVTLTEGGGLFALDRHSGEFLWGAPFPFDVPELWLKTIDPTSGKVTINEDLVFKTPGENKIICFWNTRSYWPTAYHPGTNSLYTSYIDACRDLTGATTDKPESWKAIARPGADPNALTGIAKINLSTGEVLRFNIGNTPSNGAILATAGNLIFHGDMNRRLRAFDARTGDKLWETIVGGNVSVSTITYAVAGKQYVAVITGETLKLSELLTLAPHINPPRGHNALYVFALPD